MTLMAFSAYASPDASDTSSQLNVTLHDGDATSMNLTNGMVDERASKDFFRLAKITHCTKIADAIDRSGKH